jgi:hypothetical protein
MIQNIHENHAHQYQSAVLKLYLELPETPSRAGPQDRKRAAELYTRGIKLTTVESAMLLASARRLARPPDMPPLPPIRSLTYFMPVIQELLDNPIPDDYREYLRRKVRLLDSRGQVTKCG